MNKINLESLKCVTENDIEEYLNFYKYVKTKMEEPSWLGEFSKNEIEEILNNGGMLFNYYDEETIACSCFYIPTTNKMLLKHNINYDETIVGSCGPIMVNPEYVGSGLQQQMLKKLEAYCKEKGQKYILTKIHPDNIFSIKNFEKEGYEFIEMYESKHGGKRNVYLKEI